MSEPGGRTAYEAYRALFHKDCWMPEWAALDTAAQERWNVAAAHTEASEYDKERLAAIAAGETFRCPRVEESSPVFHTYQLGLAAFWQHDKTCSYCGSLAPAEFFAAIDAGVELGPTGKSYKVYLRGEHAPPVRGAPKFYFQHLSDEERQRFVDLVNAKKLNIGDPGYFHTLPFFMVALED